ncbi:unnamed protein product [Tuber aestivum]|uniref:Aminoglycoside phosphotransferase domain-containing protein n=1 Tax=Tuber aestivum TaxID=59557 RepID=A0A292PTD4_9PEZI|nr:unnamed protein product [Tuber aestivum]
MTSTPSHHPSLPFGLRWESNFYGPVPAWAATPNVVAIEALSRQHLSADNLSVKYLAGGAFNKVYLITVPSDNILDPKSYIFRVTLPVEPFYKTAIPEVFAYDCTTKNELGSEWIIMERIPGVCLRELWPRLSLESKGIIVERLGQFTKELREKCRFNAIGSLYQCTELSEGNLEVTVATDYNDFVIGPIVNSFIFAEKRKPLIKRDRGPYRSDRVYLLALMKVELEDKRLLLKLTSDKRAASIQKAKHEYSESDSDDDLAEDAPEIQETIQQLLEILPSIFSEDMQTEEFTLRHHNLNRSNVMVDCMTLEITGILDWECPEPLAFGDTDECRVRRWEKWEKTKLRKIFDQAAGSGANNDKDACDKRGFRERLDLLEFSTKMVRDWIVKYRYEKQKREQGY